MENFVNWAQQQHDLSPDTQLTLEVYMERLAVLDSADEDQKISDAQRWADEQAANK